MNAPAISLLPRTTCPHCWSKFAPEEVLWVASHTDLVGDPRLGPDQLQRFLPTRFNAEGHAIDGRGFACQHLACPHCHLGIPAGLLEMEPLFVSILGTPACGKSFFLAAMTSELRRLLPAHFGLSYLDTDPVGNLLLSDYQQSLFQHAKPDELVPLADLIRKTELQGDLYDNVLYGNQTVSYPRPFLFTLRPLDHHPHAKMAKQLSRVLCLYDNAGEHFEPGKETPGSPVTRHMAQAAFLLHLYDPMQDRRLRQAAQQGRPGGEKPGARSTRQEMVLIEAAARVRRSLGLPEDARHERPLIVVLTKSDEWLHLLPEFDGREPWVTRDRLAGLDADRIEVRSTHVRNLLLRYCPELIGAAESFAREVIYVPVSALGRIPEVGAKHPALIRPREIVPAWVTVPLLYGLCRWVKGMIPALKRAAPSAGAKAAAIAAPGEKGRT